MAQAHDEIIGDQRAPTLLRIDPGMKTSPVSVSGVTIGAKEFVVIAGPCAVESYSQLMSTAEMITLMGGAMLRGGIYKMRTSPRSFQGLGSEAYEIVRELRKKIKIPLVSEISDPRQIEELYDLVDLFQIGTRNMYNYPLLKEMGQINKPVLLKRGFSALIDEWLKAADYIRSGGNKNVILCERGIRTFETAMRNTLDLAAVPYIKQHSDLPILVDPSHGTGVRSLIAPMSLAAAAAGADGLLLEIHPNPAQALSDSDQALSFSDFQTLMTQLRRVLEAIHRPLHPTPS